MINGTHYEAAAIFVNDSGCGRLPAIIVLAGRGGAAD